MTPFPYYETTPPKAPPAPQPIDVLPRERHTGGAGYEPDERLAAAVNVALVLGRPLLVTGEPGTGKTQLADSVAYQLGYPLLRFDTKSTSAARDLFYIYDAIGRFDAAYSRAAPGAQASPGGTQAGALPEIDKRDFIHYQALGKAILLANGGAALDRWLPSSPARRQWLPAGWTGEKTRAVVLIDEIDKAPRDFPNDLLAEIEELRFTVTELDNAECKADKDFRPVVIITSNSEKHLPDAFLRRCVYHHIAFPEDTVEGRSRLMSIVRRRAGLEATDALITATVEFLFEVRKKDKLNKKPATAEIIDWLAWLHQRGARDREWLRAHPVEVEASMGALFKNKDDRESGESELKAWLGK